jgi:hypothetical protein
VILQDLVHLLHFAPSAMAGVGAAIIIAMPHIIAKITPRTVHL